MKTNKENLVVQSVIGEIHSPSLPASPYKINQTGEAVVVHGTGGIVYNFKIGDSCMGIIGDHIEPGVSIKNPDPLENNALNVLSCVGNTATVVSGRAQSKTGFVTGSHGGIEHVLIYFDQETLDQLAIGDKIQIKAWGQGLKINGLDSVKVLNLDPDLLEKIPKRIDNGRLVLPVVTEIPAKLMGSGIGSDSFRGDYDIMTGDREANKKYGLDKLRFGDLVLLKDSDTSTSRQFLSGAVTVGVIVHSDCIKAGHGPGVTSLFTCRKGNIVGEIDENANIANYLGVK